MSALKKLKIENHKVHNYLLAKNYELVYGMSSDKKVVYRGYLGGVAKYIEIHEWKSIVCYTSYPFVKHDREIDELIKTAKNSIKQISEVISKWLA